MFHKFYFICSLHGCLFYLRNMMLNGGKLRQTFFSLLLYIKTVASRGDPSGGSNFVGSLILSKDEDALPDIFKSLHQITSLIMRHAGQGNV